MQKKIVQNIENSKLLAKCLADTLSEASSDERYAITLQFALQKADLTKKQAKRLVKLIHKCLGAFPNDMLLAGLSLIANRDNTTFDRQLVTSTHDKMLTVLGMRDEAKAEETTSEDKSTAAEAS